MNYAKPVPVPDHLSAPFWEAARRHELAVQCCEACGHFAYPPVAVCENCRNPAPRFRFQPVSGRGRLVSWIVMRDCFIPAFKGELPFVIGLVELAEQPGLRMIARLMDGADAAYRLEAAVHVVFEDITADATLPQFKLSDTGHVNNGGRA